jgi:hypothetical protein
MLAEEHPDVFAEAVRYEQITKMVDSTPGRKAKVYWIY